MTDQRAPKFPVPDVRQILIPPGLWDVTELFFLNAGFALAKVPYLDDDEPTYFLARLPQDDLPALQRQVHARLTKATENARD